jgi:hypothetical protein
MSTFADVVDQIGTAKLNDIHLKRDSHTYSPHLRSLVAGII